MIESLSLQGLSRINVRRGVVVALIGVSAAVAGACTPGKLVSGAAKAPGVPGEGCDPKALNEINSPLVIEWPSDARSDLESAMHDGVVVVSFTCEKVKVLPDCKVAGSYGYRAVTPREESVLIEGRDNIQASFGGVSWAVGGSLERDAKLDLSYMLVGKQSTILNSLHDKELEGGDFCKGATHFVKRADVGAFAYATGTRVAAGMSAKVMGQGASGSSENKEVKTKRDGDPATCKGSRLADEKAPEGCGAAIRVSLVPIKSSGVSKAESLSKKGLSDGLGCPTGFVYADGACTKDAGKVKAFLCKEGDQKECQKQCTAGSDASCDRFARALLYGEDENKDLGKVAESIQGSAQRFEESCKADQPNTCAALAILAFAPMLGGGDFDKKQATKGFDYMARGCVAGDFTSCLFLRFIGMDAEIKKETGIDGQKLLVQTIERGCRAGNAVPCGFVSVEAASGENIRRDPKRAVELAESACRGSFAEACQIHAALLGDHGRCEAIFQGINEKMGRLYHAEAICDDAVLEAIPDDAKKAAASLKRACDLGAQPACGG
jgi:TPR repeat protein